MSDSQLNPRVHPDVLIERTLVGGSHAFWIWGNTLGAMYRNGNGTEGFPIESAHLVPGCEGASAGVYCAWAPGRVHLSASTKQNTISVKMSPNDALTLAHKLIEYAGLAAKHAGIAESE